MSYRIKTVAELTGIPRNTILAWERRYNLFSPRRTPGGYRVFTDADVDMLRALKAHLDAGLKISEAISMLQERHPTPPPPPLTNVRLLRDRLLDRLLQFDRSGADRLRGELGMLSFREKLDDVLMPLLAAVGDAWEAGEVSVAQEHFVAAFCREHMISMFHSLDAGPEQGPEAVCAGFPGEQHELGLLSVAIRLALSGYRVQYLGADLPAAELVKMLHGRPCRLVCQSVMQVRPVVEILHHIAELRRGIPPEVVIALGGPGAEAARDRVPAGVVVCETPDEILGLVGPTLARA